jgi:hypothetical protein
MTSIAHSSVSIQASPQSAPSLACWFGEATLIARHLQRQGVLAAIEEQVRFARRRFGQDEVIDFVAVLLGYAISGERTLEAFYECLQRMPQTRSWPFSDATACQPVRRSVVFSPRWIRPQSSPCAPCFSKMGFLVLW